MIRTIHGQEITFESDPHEREWGAFLDPEGARVAIRFGKYDIYHGKQRAPAVDWDAVDAFVGHWLTHREVLARKADERLRRLLRQLRWNDIHPSNSVFSLCGVSATRIRPKRFLGESHKFKDLFMFETTWVLNGIESWYWPDTYGLYYVCFRNDQCAGARREQV